MLEPLGLYRINDKRPDGVTMIPWEMGKQLVWDVTVVDALASSSLNQGSLCNPGTTATEADARKIEKYRELIDNGFIFQPVVLEVQGSLSESSEIFITRNCKMLCRSHNDQRAGSFLEQRSSMALQIGNAACVLGTVSNRDAFEEIYYKKIFFQKNLCIIAALRNFYRSTAIVSGMSSLLVVLFCYWSIGIVTSMGLPTFVADHGCVSSPPNMMMHKALGV